MGSGIGRGSEAVKLENGAGVSEAGADGIGTSCWVTVTSEEVGAIIAYMVILACSSSLAPYQGTFLCLLLIWSFQPLTR